MESGDESAGKLEIQCSNDLENAPDNFRESFPATLDGKSEHQKNGGIS